MRFIDEAKIELIAGHGGPGSVSFRREKYIPRGGPDGGDGGKGGDIVFQASRQMSTLSDFRYKRTFKAESGQHGQGANKTGRDGKSVTIRVPQGTVIRSRDTGEILMDMNYPDQLWPVCKGGRGGKGNSHFASSTHQTPKFAQPGEEGESVAIQMELKLLADAGIIGFPNAGKSTLISVLSAAKPKIADYAFTTLTPVLGVVEFSDNTSIVVADIPGLVEGAHEGAGLGHKFLRHIERTKSVVHLIDGQQVMEILTKPQPYNDQGELDDHWDPVEEACKKVVELYKTIRGELAQYDERLLHKPELVAINKIDLLDREIFEKIRLHLRKQINSIRGTHPEADEPLLVSGVTGEGVDKLREWLQEFFQSHRKPQQTEVPLPFEII